MSYPLHTYAIINHIEAHLGKGKPDYSELEQRTGFSAWAKMLSDDKTCSIDNDSIRFEHMLCEDDATTCLIDGRGCAAQYFKKLAESEAGTASAETLEKYKSLSNLFAKTKALAEQTWSLLGGWDSMEQLPAKLAEKEVRKKACEYIKQIEVLETQSLEMLQKIIAQ